jgi:hypothetical protein
MGKRAKAAFFSLLFGSLAAAACGARSELQAPGKPDAPDDPDDPAEICAKLNATAEPVVVDMFFLFDASGSMAELTAAGLTKWQSLNEAMWSFLFDPSAAGLRVGVGFFPEHDFGVPAYCYNGLGCAGTNDCTPLGSCLPSGSTICSTDEQCPGDDDTCQLSGYCSAVSGEACDPRVNDCRFGECEAIGYCKSHTHCGVDAYHIKGVATLPQDAFGVGNAIAGHTLEGFTPTLPAYQGLLESALEWRGQNENDFVVTVLATDGLPTMCDPSLQTEGVDAGVQNLADVAANGLAQGIKSYVLGVFAPAEEEIAAQRLDTIAAAGGTVSAYVVTTSDDVATRLIEALNEVRLENACSYLLPPGVEQLDLSKVRVAATFEDESTIDLVQRSGSAACDAAAGGFYFDPAPPATPTRIVLCPTSCGLHPTSILVTCRA